ncbi:MAG: iron-siderophore ABC transporter substrate-binding protein [Leptolyngbya sp. SIO1E4]|nr:iron-siderophore ABC transporter substrate-binding protein [Leptolyngbya sp. SIO1E4]
MKIILNARLLVLTAVVAFAIAACNTKTLSTDSDQNPASQLSATPTDCRTIEHEAGETEVCGQPQRIVVLGSYVLEPLLALDVQPIGYAEYVAFHQGDYTDPSQQIPYLGDLMAPPLANVGTASQPSIEAIIEAQPDLILAAEFINAGEYDTLSRIAPTLLLDYDEPEQSLSAIALATNRIEQADQLLTQTAQQLEEAQAIFASLAATHPKVALLSPSDLQNIQVITNSASHCGSLIEELGFQLVFPPGLNNDDSSPSAPISLESLPQLNDADIVILLGYNFSDFKSLGSVDRFEEHQLSKLKQAWEENAIAQSLDASQAGRAYFIPGYLCAGLPGPIGTELYLEELKEQLLSSHEGTD